MSVRVRFAPSPTGHLHLGNVRTALFNYLFARQKHGTFIVRIEDTDAQRNIEDGVDYILQDFRWLGLEYDEGPIIGGSHEPYFQSQRTVIYEKHLADLIARDNVYRCFCTPEELEAKRRAQLARKEPPRYDRACLALGNDAIARNLDERMPFVWRFKLDDARVEVRTLDRGDMHFDLKHFSDPVLVREDGSFTFAFVNFVDDYRMGVTHVIRGEDHLSNTAVQVAFYNAFGQTPPVYWHLSFLVNVNGKKMSKRDAGFSLTDLKRDGFLPQSIVNYLAITGGSFEVEVQSLAELINSFDFSSIHTTGPITYDVEKLTWLNHQWLKRLSGHDLLPHVVPFIEDVFPVHSFSRDQLAHMIEVVKNEANVITDFLTLLSFCFYEPDISRDELTSLVGAEATQVLGVIFNHLNLLEKPDAFLDVVKQQAREMGVKPRTLFHTLRYLLIGSTEGTSINDLFELLDAATLRKRLSRL